MSEQTRGTNRVAFGLGANLGDRLGALQCAVDVVCASNDIHPVAVSPIFETDAVGGPAQPAYLNAVLVVETSRDPESLLSLAHEAEQSMNRTRSVRWGPRTLDVDVLAVGEVVMDTEDLVLPHPRAYERTFVLVPWAAADPDALIAGRGSVVSLRDTAVLVDAPEAVRLTALTLRLPE